ncbi:Re/Si-specific NAD(P)(+) transhydrogenase subunit alpha [Pontiella sulfatireligans]|uniref:NAD(P) transhydrogenase subunit alpha part 1 n=1 Tax=Pontiella sulfatireligans TaxID=2750658 RepID=A0A6C2UKC0_9BACT|nr:Re/Si-specific NAD(P)(+) transhydrogenase subunit alpha [Pontiella sulfatireligans]VGO19851.1 NAD(P) transhydrogenase subunit alpha part 1 [Pontiella sulfatireligans]
MLVAVPKEILPGENRVALIPATIPALTKAGLEVLVESGAGAGCFIADEAYVKAGAKVAPNADELYAAADIILKVRPPEADEVGRMKEGVALVCLMDAFFRLDLMQKLADRKISGFGLEFVPRITRAQSMDVLSSMAAISGYRAVIEAADLLPKYFPMLMTSAGTITPSKVFVIGAGVAGLMAIATAKRLGAVVEAYDTRPAVKEQVESVGAKFVEFDLETADAEDKGGYAKAQSDDFYKKQQEQMKAKVATVDVVITTAAIPGKTAPVLITDEMLQAMKPGSVIIDLAAERGGNTEGAVANEVVEKHGVKVVGYTDYPSRSSIHASQLFSKNISTFLLNMVKEEQFAIDLEDEIVKGALLVHDGQVVHDMIKPLMEQQGA